MIIGCNSNTSSLSEGQKIAVKNSIKYIKKSSFSNKKHIDTKIIKIENINDEGHRKAVCNNGSRVEENKVDLTDWIITIGSTSGHDFVFIVCDSSTYGVIGYIPID
jgi:uncharacterized metal-binding protein